MSTSGPVVAPLPALIIGVLVMRLTDVSTAIWGLQLGLGAALAALCVGLGVALRRPRPHSSRPRAAAITGIAAFLLLASTLAQPGIDGVRRWVPLGPLQLHAGFILLPVLLIVFGTVMRSRPRGTWLVAVAIATTSVVLTLQPDPSQASAFALAALVLLLGWRQPSRVEWSAIVAAALCALVAWTRPDPLTAVPYVEGIVALAGSLGVAWQVASVLAVALLPLPFIVVRWETAADAPTACALAAYFAAVSCAPLVGPYPVPMLGFGISPMMGYFAALGWVILKQV